MKKTFVFSFCILLMAACNNDSASINDAKAATSTPTDVQLPYTAAYTSQWNDSVSDQDVLTVLNSYKYWEAGDMKSLDNVMADSVTFLSHSGFKHIGPKAGLMSMWAKSRDSLSNVTLRIDSWRKSHSIDKKRDFVSIWYKETVTYKDGRVDSAYYQDDNMLTNGKIAWYAQQKRVLK